MAITSDTILTIMGRNTAYRLYGVPSTDELTDILVSALCRYCQIDPPRISASLAFATGDTSAVLPSALRNAQIIYNEAGEELTGWQERDGIISFSEALDGGASVSPTLTVWGFPASVRSDVDSILAQIPEVRENILLTYCRAYYYDAMGAADTDAWMQKADQMLTKEMLSENRTGTDTGMTFRQVDAYGRTVDPGSSDTDDFSTEVYTDMGMDY